MALNSLRLQAKNKALTYTFAYQYKAIDKNFRFETMSARHMPDLMDLSKGFFEDESITAATGSTSENCKKAMEYVFEYTIAANCVIDTARICYDNKTNKAVGFRWASPVYRDASKAPFTVPEPTLGKQEISLFTPIDEAFNKVWDIYPNEDVILKGDMVYVDRKYRKHGLMQVWINYGLDFPLLSKQTGANIFAILCSARSTKGWFEKLGYNTVYSSPPFVKNTSGETVMLPQGDLRLVTTDLNTGVASINVKPIWDGMKSLKMM